MKVYPTVAIISPIHNHWPETQAWLNSIKKLNYPQEKLEIIIIDNASTDASVEKIQKRFSEVKVIRNPTNVGFPRAINQGAKKARSELLLITNNDIVYQENCLKELVRTFQTDSKIAIVGGKVCWQDQDKLCIDGFRLNPYLGYHQYDLSRQDQQRECDWVYGSCFLIKRKFFLGLSGFDENYFLYFDDIDFSLKVKRAGYKLVYTPKAIAFHDHSRTIFNSFNPETVFYFGYQSRWYCLFKNASLFEVLTSSFFLLTLAPLYQSFLTGHNVFKPMFKGLLSTLKRWPKRRKAHHHSTPGVE